MLSKQRRSSQRLASVLEAMTSDLEDFNEVEVSTETEEDLIDADEADALADYVERDVDWKNLSKEEQLQMIGDEDEEIEEADEDEDEEVDFDDELDELEDSIEESEEDSIEESEEDDDEVFSFEDEESEEDDEIEAAIEDEIGNETNGNGPGGDRSVSLEKDLVGDGNVEFDKEDEYEDSIRNVVTARKARVASIVAKLDNIADRLEKAGNKKLAYRVDVVSDKLEKEYLK